MIRGFLAINAILTIGLLVSKLRSESEKRQPFNLNPKGLVSNYAFSQGGVIGAAGCQSVQLFWRFENGRLVGDSGKFFCFCHFLFDTFALKCGGVSGFSGSSSVEKKGGVIR